MTQTLAALAAFAIVLQNNVKPITYKITPGPAEEIKFVARTSYETYSGTTDQVSGEVSVVPEHPADMTTASVSVKVATLHTGNRSRDKKMRSDFLEVDKYPTAKFVVDKIVSSESGGLELNRMIRGTVQGTFTLHGVTHKISPDVLVTRERTGDGRDSIHIVGDFAVRLDDYGIATPKFLLFKVKQNHRIYLDIHAVATSSGE